MQEPLGRLADLLLHEVAISLGRSDPDSIEDELVALELLPYCRSAVARPEMTSPPSAVASGMPSR